MHKTEIHEYQLIIKPNALHNGLSTQISLILITGFINQVHPFYQRKNVWRLFVLEHHSFSLFFTYIQFSWKDSEKLSEMIKIKFSLSYEKWPNFSVCIIYLLLWNKKQEKFKSEVTFHLMKRSKVENNF